MSDTPSKVKARVDARGWWRIGRVRIERKTGDNPAELKALAMKIEAMMNGELEREVAELREKIRLLENEKLGGQIDTLRAISADIHELKGQAVSDTQTDAKFLRAIAGDYEYTNKSPHFERLMKIADALESREREVAELREARPIMAEVARAVAKFPTWPTDPLHALAVLGEEFGELTKAMVQLTYEPHKTSADEVRTEALQTAAMALRLYHSLGKYDYRPSPQHEQAALKGKR